MSFWERVVGEVGVGDGWCDALRERFAAPVRRGMSAARIHRIASVCTPSRTRRSLRFGHSAFEMMFALTRRARHLRSLDALCTKA